MPDPAGPALALAGMHRPCFGRRIPPAVCALPVGRMTVPAGVFPSGP